MAGCSSCGTGNDGTAVAGCKSNGGCSTGGCNKMNVFDWLSNMGVPSVDTFEVVEVRFKGGRKEFFRNSAGLDLTTGDAVVVDVPNGHHIGYISMQGELVRLQMQKKKIKNDGEIRKVYRIATGKDIDKYNEVKDKEMPTLYKARRIITDLKLEMKLSDIEYQADNTKATFYYSADDRVDFRELIKILAAEFKVRIEMRQISLRQEAGRLGGLGSCGRELCCSTWLSDFRSVSTSAARYQNLSLNPSKLSGQCGRLKCCLNYELDTYMDALSDIPKLEGPLKTEKGDAKLQKTDIFRKIMWFGYEDESLWHPISIHRVKEIIALNKSGKLPDSLMEDDVISEKLSGVHSLNSDLEKMDRKYKDKSRSNKKRRNSKPKKKKEPQTAVKNSSKEVTKKSGTNTGKSKNNTRNRNNTTRKKSSNNNKPRGKK